MVAVVTALTLLAGCGNSGGPSSSGNSGGSGAEQITLTVFAAASLTGSFSTLGTQFEAAHPGTTVRFSFGPSSGLAAQIGQGAPADVFASASAKNLAQVSDLVGPARTFARNAMRIAVPPDNPAGIRSIADLARPGVKLALCQEQVPCGVVARQVFAKAQITPTPVSQEVDVKATLTKVRLGEVDAGMVYVSDVLAAGSAVTGITIPDAVNATTDYPIATLKASPHAATAQQFVDFVLSADALAVLTAAGFQAP